MTPKGYVNDFYKQFEELNKKLDKLLSENKSQALTIANLNAELKAEQRKNAELMAKINKLLEERDKYKNQDERTYKCCDCHQIMDRDLNASINIMFEGLKLYMNNQLSRV